MENNTINNENNVLKTAAGRITTITSASVNDNEMTVDTSSAKKILHQSIPVAHPQHDFSTLPVPQRKKNISSHLSKLRNKILKGASSYYNFYNICGLLKHSPKINILFKLFLFF